MPISDEERKARQRDYAKRRYHGDAKHRERKKATMRAYAAEHQASGRHAERMESDPEYAERRRASSRRSSARHVARIKELVAAHKDRPCVDCGEQYESFNMEFDHVRGEKKFGLGHAARTNRSVKQVLEEIAKCDVRCVLCHRRRHLAPQE